MSITGRPLSWTGFSVSVVPISHTSVPWIRSTSSVSEGSPFLQRYRISSIIRLSGLRIRAKIVTSHFENGYVYSDYLNYNEISFLGYIFISDQSEALFFFLFLDDFRFWSLKLNLNHQWDSNKAKDFIFLVFPIWLLTCSFCLAFLFFIPCLLFTA